MNKSASDKIRRLIKKNPNASYDDLKKIFKVVNRSIIVTYYRIYKETFEKSGSLKRNVIRSAPVRERVLAYFEKYPDHTIDKASKSLKMNYARVYATVYNARLSGFAVSFKKACGRKNTGIAETIRQYIKSHPKAKPKECAKAVGTSANYVSLIKYRMKYWTKDDIVTLEEKNARL